MEKQLVKLQKISAVIAIVSLIAFLLFSLGGFVYKTQIQSSPEANVDIGILDIKMNE
ncbi:hypothetical protein KC717_04675 [Candidatus Dojkabacteria bacterium]|uniref:Uncharacterized protein n=1 Tax=Candidatus Dojkabacteria bacterium TaxID=2099670 RepID=A0A955RKI5_9BACT|nr:hypothetical protein [Candidatus Dojkabacteria bacterium]